MPYKLHFKRVAVPFLKCKPSQEHVSRKRVGAPKLLGLDLMLTNNINSHLSAPSLITQNLLGIGISCRIGSSDGLFLA